MSYTGEAEGPAVRVGTSVVDLGTGMWTAIAVLAALRERDRTGVGTRISASLFDTALAWSGYHLIGHAANGTVAGRHGTELPMICPYGSFPAADGAVMIAVGNDALFGRLCVALGLEEARADARFATNPERVAHRAALNALMGARTAERTVERLLADLREAGVPCAPIQDIAQVAVDPQTGASEMLHPPEGGEGVPNVAIPLRWDGLRGEASHAPPAAGADTKAVLRELDYTADEIDELRRSATV